MELLNRIVGLLLVIGVFALRTGAGLSVLLGRKHSLGAKWATAAGIFLAYASVFFGAEWILYHRGASGILDYVRDPSQTTALWGFAGACALIWAIILFLPVRSERILFCRSLFMALPEPASLLVIVLGTILVLTFSAGSLPGLELAITAGLWLGFVLLSLAWMALARSGRWLKEPRARLAVGVGLLLSAGFLLYVVRPRSEPALLDQVFTIAAFKEVDKAQNNTWEYGGLATAGVMVFSAGFWFVRKKLKGTGT